MSQVTFLNQQVPVDEYGRAIYAVGRSILRALLDQMSDQDLEDTAGEGSAVTMRQLTHYARLEGDKGMRGDGFEWAVHEAIVGGRLVLPSTWQTLSARPLRSSGGHRARPR